MKTKLYFPFCLLLFASLFIQSCQSESKAKEQHLFIEYFVRYLETERELKANATFLKGDTLQTAKPKTFLGGIQFQGNDMVLKNVSNDVARYTLIQNGVNFYQPLTFNYLDDDGAAQDFSIAMGKPGPFQFYKNRIVKKEGIQMLIENGDLTEDESLVVFFTDKDYKAAILNLRGPHQGNEYYFTPNQVTGLTPGLNEVYLVKKKHLVQKSEKQTVVADIEFYTNPGKVEILE
ncbi:MAG TPA: hypothetical protein PKA00_09285 [Saprospiraceae bacterium]|nr:hypothetical protein [Saprospiraceae bacterium]HMQ83090.1 hypothetical protein [Saprospiraceae bacterium]